MINELPSVEQSYATELIRKGIHLCSLSIPLVYYWISREQALSILVPLALILGVLDVARLYHPATGRLYSKYLGFLLRPHERTEHGRKLNGATYVLLSAIICVMLFPKVIVITAFAVLIISDTSAALIGRRFGRHRFFNKSVEGTTAFFVSGLLVVALAPKVAWLPAEYAIGAIAVLIGAIVEASPVPLDDNLSIPLSVGTVMWAMYMMFLPAVDVFALDRLF
jgi:dolichol kinase